MMTSLQSMAHAPYLILSGKKIRLVVDGLGGWTSLRERGGHRPGCGACARAVRSRGPYHGGRIKCSSTSVRHHRSCSAAASLFSTPMYARVLAHPTPHESQSRPSTGDATSAILFAGPLRAAYASTHEPERRWTTMKLQRVLRGWPGWRS